MSAVLPISRLIAVTINLEPQAAQAQDISTLLLLSDNPAIDMTEQYRLFPGDAEVAQALGDQDPAYKASVLWFEQTPRPKQIMVGRWAKTATKARLVGAILMANQQLISNWNAVTAGGFFMLMNNVPLSITGLNFGASTNLNNAALLIQTALSAKSFGATALYNGTYQRFEIDSGATGEASSVSFISAPTASGSFNFSNQPASNDSITLNGTAITFVAGAPVGNQVLIGANLNETLANLRTFATASQDVQLVKFRYTVVDNYFYVYSATTGAGGNALTIAKAGANITVSGATLSGGSATDISGMVNATQASSGAYVAQGALAETAVQCELRFDLKYGQKWYGVFALGATNDDILAIAPAVESSVNKHVQGVTTQEGGVLVASDTTNVAYLLKQAKYKKTVVQYSSKTPYAVCSLMARIMTTNYAANNSVITLMYKQEPGIVPESLDSNQMAALKGNNCNVFVEYSNDTAIIEPGVMSSGNWCDEVFGTDWLALAIQTDLYNALYLSPTKIPQTDDGNHTLATVIMNRCSQAVNNGLLAPGVWTSGPIGSLNTGDFMPAGFYVYAPPVALQPVADRAARKSVAFQVAAKLAGAIHTIDVIVNVNR